MDKKTLKGIITGLFISFPLLWLKQIFLDKKEKREIEKLSLKYPSEIIDYLKDKILSIHSPSREMMEKKIGLSNTEIQHDPLLPDKCQKCFRRGAYPECEMNAHELSNRIRTGNIALYTVGPGYVADLIDSIDKYGCANFVDKIHISNIMGD